MIELVKAGGWPMIPLLLLSFVALAIIVERFWSLRRSAIMPPGLGEEVREWAKRLGILDHGIGDVDQLAGGIGKALICTATGMIVAVPALVFHRYFRGRIAGYIVDMEHEAMQLIDVLEAREHH